MGCRAVIARSFARIHETNLKKQGLVPLTVPGYRAPTGALSGVERCLRRMSDPEPDARYKNMAEAARSLRAALVSADLSPGTPIRGGA